MLHYCHSLEVNRPEVMAVTDSALGNDNSQGSTEVDKMLKVHCTARVAMQSSWPSGDDGWTIWDFQCAWFSKPSSATGVSLILCVRNTCSRSRFGCSRAMSWLHCGDAWSFHDGQARLLQRVHRAADGCDRSQIGAYGRVSRDSGFETQKSLAFIAAALWQQLRRPQTTDWTQNMWVDGGAEHMDNTNLRKTLQRGTWSVTYNQQFTKQISRKNKNPEYRTLITIYILPFGFYCLFSWKILIILKNLCLIFWVSIIVFF